MLFHSQIFLFGFLPIVLAGVRLAGHRAGTRGAQLWLISASVVFYGWWDWRFVPLLVGSIGTNFWLGSRILRHATTGRRNLAHHWLIAGVLLNLSLLGWFKYAGFLLHTLAPGAPRLHIVLPLAISFFTFQQVMFLVDSFRAGRTSTSLLPYATFVAFFPHLIAGPIVRPKEIIPQLAAPALARPTPDNLSAGLMLLLLGLAKKLVLADMFGPFADTGFDAAATGAELSFFEAWYALLAYALQIYFDFSGYSDMAIGLARMLNVRFPVNFASPYQSRTIAEFWRRWHITLGLFLRDYLYIPLGGSRRGETRRALNLMLTMLLAGLWHGAAWRFVLWGGLHGAFLVAHAQYRRFGPALPRLPAQALTLLAVLLAWVPFRAADLPTAWAMLRGLAGANGVALPQMLVHAVPVLSLVATPVPVLPFLGDGRTLSFPEVSACLLLGWFIVLALPDVHTMPDRARCRALATGFAFTVQALVFAPHVAPFLYFQF